MSTSMMRPAPPSKLWPTIWLIVSAIVVVAAIWAVDAKWARMLDLPGAFVNYAVLMGEGVVQNPFVDPWSEYWSLATSRMLESVQMAWIGTLIGAVLSLPLGFLAARTIAPAGVVVVVRQFLNAIRALPEIVLAIVLIMPIFGLGPLTGALALGVGSIGTLGKLTAEAIESIDPGPVEAALASGAGASQRIRWAILPQALPEIVAFWLYRFEINIRASAVLGVIGAGGIGSLLSQLFNRREWAQIGVTLVVIIVVTILVDTVSGAVRARIISGGSRRTRRRERREQAEAIV
ncbi:phosphonate ABC transporter, permease protein PhnE [Microbacterium thalassium]|uniref:Phosphonate transport system permease protein n=1 Tax=Microbacterium thalassium TaxID=362649 RepID=A0A7X0FNQ7_9MICO|nr:phosphonate ABC transporter, permease protein PhnE [Microbacterium thalassium]MBB6390912.1 phosphonate transport system permease protein [Microbacterium thalassium]